MFDDELTVEDEPLPVVVEVYELPLDEVVELPPVE